MNKTMSIKIRVDEGELATIRQRAAQSGRSVSEFLRQAAGSLYVHAPIDREVTRSISRWSQNLNQLAHHANRGGDLDIDAIRDLRAEAVRILQALEARR